MDSRNFIDARAGLRSTFQPDDKGEYSAHPPDADQIARVHAQAALLQAEAFAEIASGLCEIAAAIKSRPRPTVSVGVHTGFRLRLRRRRRGVQAGTGRRSEAAAARDAAREIVREGGL